VLFPVSVWADVTVVRTRQSNKTLKAIPNDFLMAHLLWNFGKIFWAAKESITGQTLSTGLIAFY